MVGLPVVVVRCRGCRGTVVHVRYVEDEEKLTEVQQRGVVEVLQA